MEGINTSFSSDDEYFEDFRPRQRHRRMKTDLDIARENNPVFDPPSKVCGGAVFSKLMSIGSSGGKSHNKASVDSSHDKKQKKKRQSGPQQKHRNHNRNHNLHRHRHEEEEQHDENSSKLIAKMTHKIMKRKKDPEESPSFQLTEDHSFKPKVVMPSTDTTMSSLSEPSILSSPWVTDETDDVDGFYNYKVEMMHHRSRRVGGVAVMGESTAKYTNQKQSPRQSNSISNNSNNSPSVRDLESLLKEMKNLNGMVQENTTVLQKGIENIAQELEHQSKHHRTGVRHSWDDDEDHENWEKEETNQNRPNGGSSSVSSSGKINEIEKLELELERNHYRSEAETLRLEMKDIKEQLSELRKYLPQVSGNADHKRPQLSGNADHKPQHSNASSMDLVQTNVSYLESWGDGSDSNAKSHADSENALSLTAIDNPPTTFRCEINEILSKSERNSRSALRRKYMLQRAEAKSKKIHSGSTGAEDQEKDRNSGTEARKTEFAVAKSFYRRQWGKNDATTSSGMKPVSVGSMNENDSSSMGYTATTSSTTSSAAEKNEDIGDVFATGRKYRQLRKSHDFSAIQERSNDDGSTTDSSKTNPGAGESDDEYLKELRKSWYEKRGLLMDGNSCGGDGDTGTKLSSPRSAVSSTISFNSTKGVYRGERIGI